MDRRACGCRRSLIQPAGVGDGDADAAADAVDAAARPSGLPSELPNDFAEATGCVNNGQCP
jgi:hypothetical protein